MPEVIYKFLTIDHVEHTIAGMVSDFFRDYPDPTPAYQYLDGLRGRGKLESALAQPQQSFGGNTCTLPYSKWRRPCGVL